ncbi:MAG: selenocysteine-specific translation elongation factor [Actinomycetota bacterium]
MPIIATAGHVDHGKSTLVLALSGIDPDRLEEEKRRGLTVDLGFAHFTTPAGRLVGIVDVPGHERFIKNMLAGVGAIDLNLFLVAANEGWKPQSQEHLDIMNLLGVCRAIVVLSKVDAATPDQIAKVRRTVAERLEGTSLEASPVVELSATTGQGMPELLGLIDEALAGATRPEPRRPRMWVDRAFTIKGSGTVVTGTLSGGALRVGQEVEILPAKHRARIRTIQSHNQELAKVDPGSRAALNLSGVEKGGIKRGDVLAAPGIWRATQRMLARVRFLPGEFEPRAGTGYKLHVGSIEIETALRFVGEVPAAGEEGIVLALLDKPTVLDFHDRFILRDSGRHQTVAGGQVLEAHAERLGRSTVGLAAAAVARETAGNGAAYLEVLLLEQGAIPLDEVLVQSGLANTEYPPEALRLGDYLASRTWFNRTAEGVAGRLRLYQQAHPVESGMPVTVLRKDVALAAPVLGVLLDELVRTGVVVADATAVRTADFTPQTSRPEQLELLEMLREAGAAPPSLAELNQKYDSALVRSLIRTGQVIQVTPFVFSAEFMAGLKESVLRRVAGTGPFTVAEFRDLIGTTRKYAVPLLEHLDHTGFTARRGALRVLGPKAG